MKTAMQEMIDWLKGQESACLQYGNQYQADFLNGHISVALKLIEKEKQQIIDAITYGQNNHTVSITSDIEIAEQYYNEKFNKNK